MNLFIHFLSRISSREVTGAASLHEGPRSTSQVFSNW